MVTFPLSFLSQRLGLSSVAFDMQRNDELSGSGDGRYWTAQLARPLWKVTASLHVQNPATARSIDARIRGLDGSANAFLFQDPTYEPVFGATAELAASTVTLGSISGNRTQVSLAGLPPGYVLVPGDRFSIDWGTDRVYFAEFTEDATADASGATGLARVMPYPPLSLAVGAGVELVSPKIRVFIPPNGYTPFTRQAGAYSDGASLTMLQRV